MANIVLQAPAPYMNFGTAPSGATYTSNQFGLIVITNSSVADEVALIAAGCVALYPASQTPVAATSLPSPAIAGQRAFASDSTVAGSGNFGAALTGGGTHTVPVYTDETATWRIG